ncbi:MAG: hypothetical protein K9K65_19165 [Desulfarculaceae bacterium]|nr:hypothetical protein [Desulfarculaceae bacterium]MCF8049511.1 hypothetical protein [Desulfarculaceae bacterium]MCF8064037.1 hypothetical protein [Desulfarculaceae bacterium]MCF8099964.1 hypothetical protein [Desulfarculaceae bacterium]MCF8124461.1 hypothetical protein [Desulfarculaceae bacterium]
MRPKWFKAWLAAAIAAGLLGLAGPGQGAPAFNRSQLNSLFGQAYGNCNRLRALGYNPSHIESRLRWAQGQLNNYWSNPSRFNTFPRNPYNNRELQTINPFGDYLFHGTNIRNHGGKLQTRSLDPTGIVARAQEWAKELHTITKKAETGGAREFKQDINEALAFLGRGPAIPTGGSLSQQADSQLGALTGNLRSDSGGLPGQEAPAVGGQFQNPYAGDPSVVDLSESKTLTPSLLRGTDGQPEAPPVQPPTAEATQQAMGGAGLTSVDENVLPLPKPGTSEKVDSLYRSALDNLGKGDRQSAIRDLSEAVSLLPVDPKLNLALREALKNAGWDPNLPAGFRPSPKDSQALLPAVVAGGRGTNPFPAKPASLDRGGNQAAGTASAGRSQASAAVPGAQAKSPSAQPPQNQAWQEYQKQLFAQRRELEQKLNNLLRDQKAPPPLPGGTVREVEEGVFLGLTNTQYQANELMAKGQSPITGKPYAQMLKDGDVRAYGFGKTDVLPMELARGARDSFSDGEYTMDQEHFQNLLPQINGTHYQVLNAHSNGATIAEALLRQGVIRADELNILGGDRALSRGQAYQDLLDSGTVKNVNVWINRGDPVPYLTSPAGGVLRDAGLVKTKPGTPNGPVVQYHFFGEYQPSLDFKNHAWEQYCKEMEKMRQAQKNARQ